MQSKVPLAQSCAMMSLGWWVVGGGGGLVGADWVVGWVLGGPASALVTKALILCHSLISPVFTHSRTTHPGPGDAALNSRVGKSV